MAKIWIQSSMNFFLLENLKAQITFIEKMSIMCTVNVKFIIYY